MATAIKVKASALSEDDRKRAVQLRLQIKEKRAELASLIEERKKLVGEADQA